jgi:multiple sugar transport system ATP-binding protein
MNMLPGRVASGGVVEFAGGARLPLPTGTRAAEGQPVLFGMRPEHCAIGSDGLPVEVVVVEPTGADTQIYCKFGAQDVSAVLRDRTALNPGERIGLRPDLGRSHLFDAATGQRLAA